VPEGVAEVNSVLVLGREQHLVAASTRIIAENGFDVIGVTRDEEAIALLDTGRFVAVLVGSGVEPASRPAVKRHAAARGTVVLEAVRVPTQTVEEHVREAIVPRLLEL
jgi:chitinase